MIKRKPYFVRQKNRFEKADVATATMPRGHEAYTRTVEGKQQQIRQKGAVVKKPQPLEKPEAATVVGAEHKQFTLLLDSYFHNQSEMKMMMNLIDTHKTEMEAAMSELRPLLGKFSNLEKAEQKFKTEFKEGDWNYKFLSFTKETKPYKDLYTKAFNMLEEIQREEMKKAETALSKITGQEKFEREPVTKSREYKDLIKSYIGKPLTDEAIVQFRRDVLSLILLKAAKKATGEDEEYEKDKEDTGKKPLPEDKGKAKKEPKARDLPEEEEEEGLDEAHQQLIEALQNLIASKETGVHLLGEFFSRKKEEPKKEKEAEPKKEKDEKAEKKPKKEKDEKDDKKDESDSKDRDKKKGKKKAEEDEDDKKESRKSLVDIVSPIIFKRLNDELQKALEQEKQDAFLESFEKWEKACGGAKPVFRLGKPKKGKQAKKDQKKREKEDLEKARPHKYIKRLGVSGKYDYVYSDPARYHQTKIARDTLKMSDVGAHIMGGPTKAEARTFLGLAADGSEDHRWGAAAKTFVKEPAGQYHTLRSRTMRREFQERLKAGEEYEALRDQKKDRPGKYPEIKEEKIRAEYEPDYEGQGVKEEAGTYGTKQSKIRKMKGLDEPGDHRATVKPKKIPSDEEIAKVVSDILGKEKEPIAATHKIMSTFIKKYKLTMDNIGELMPKIKLAAKIYEEFVTKKPEDASSLLTDEVIAEQNKELGEFVTATYKKYNLSNPFKTSVQDKPKVEPMKAGQLKAIGSEILKELESIKKLPRGFGGFGLYITPQFNEISIAFDTPREIRHEDEYFDSRRSRSKEQIKAFGEWNDLDGQVFDLAEKIKAKYPGVSVEIGGEVSGQGVLVLKRAGSSNYIQGAK